jgi:hypothetical protein
MKIELKILSIPHIINIDISFPCLYDASNHQKDLLLNSKWLACQAYNMEDEKEMVIIFKPDYGIALFESEAQQNQLRQFTTILSKSDMWKDVVNEIHDASFQLTY